MGDGEEKGLAAMAWKMKDNLSLHRADSCVTPFSALPYATDRSDKNPRERRVLLSAEYYSLN
jgi:hypothetical protein